MAGQDSTFWHAEAFKKAIKDLAEHEAALSQYLRVAVGTKPFAVDISTFRGAAAAALDGVIYSPVVAARRHLIKCITVGCKSAQRRCHHASLVRKLDRLVGGRGDDGDSSDVFSDSDDSAREDEEDERVIEEELVVISRDRQKRNLVACTDEDRRALLWARTAELATVDVPAAAIFCPPPVGVDGQPAPPAKPVTLVGRMAELGLAYDPSAVLAEKRCSKCDARRSDEAKLVETAALLYSDGNALAPMEMTIGEWTCPDGHDVPYDGGEDGLYSLRKSDDAGHVLLLTRSFCDGLLSFVYNSRSSYSAATSFLASLRSSFGLRRQLIVLLGRCFVATLQPTPKLFVCPKCGVNPDYIVIDGQSLGFQLRDGILVSRPALHLPSMNPKIDNYSAIRELSIRAAIRKVVKTGDRLNKTDAQALEKLHAVVSSVRPRGRLAATIENWQLKRHAATLCFRFFEGTSVDDLTGSRPRDAVNGGGIDRSGNPAGQGPPAAASGDDGGSARAAQDGTAGGLGDAPAVAPTSAPWYERVGTCHPLLDEFTAAGTEWVTVRPFILGLLGDPVVNMFAGQPQGPPRALAEELVKEDGGLWRKKATASNAVGFVANFFARIGPLLAKEPAVRMAVGGLLLFAVDVDEVVDRDFQLAAQKALDAGQTETLDFCKR
eukprot:contig_5505_g1249